MIRIRNRNKRDKEYLVDDVVFVLDIPSETDDVPGRGVQDDVLVLAEGRDLEADVQRHLHVPEKHNRGLSTWCINGSQLTVIQNGRKNLLADDGPASGLPGSVQSLVLVHAAETSRADLRVSRSRRDDRRRKLATRSIRCQTGRSLRCSSVLHFYL